MTVTKSPDDLVAEAIDLLVGDDTRHVEAVALMQRAVTSGFDVSRMVTVEAHKRSHAGGFDEHLALFRALCEAVPDVADNWYGYGLSLLKRGMYPESIAATSQAIQRMTKETRNANAFYSRARAYARLGWRSLALADIARALDEDPTLRAGIAADVDFESMHDIPDFVMLTRDPEEEPVGGELRHATEVGFASNPDFERAILANPNSEQAYLVYADWLTEQGDPRGELISLQHAMATDPAKRSAAMVRERALFHEHSAALLGPLRHRRLVKDVVWRCGFVQSLKLTADPDEKVVHLDTLLERVLEHPSVRFLETLVLGTEMVGSDLAYQPAIATIVARGKLPALRCLFIADFPRRKLSYSMLGDAGALYAAVPNLRELTFHAGSMTLGTIDVPELRTFRVQTTGLSIQSLADIVNAHWPKLETLEIWFGDPSCGCDCTIEHLAAILAAQNLARVRHLGLRNAVFTDDIVKALVGSKILPQLVTLDLSLGCMTGEGVETILAAKNAFAHLEKLDVSDNAVGDDLAERLQGICAKVVSGCQNPNRVSEGRRDPAVGE